MQQAGARGIGVGIALELARRGCDVAILDVMDSAGTAGQIEATGQRALAIYVLKRAFEAIVGEETALNGNGAEDVVE